MSYLTNNLGLVKPNISTDTIGQSIPQFNNNFDVIDEEITSLRTDIKSRSINISSSPYNAIGDGITNNIVAIQSAINAVKASGGKVIVPAGKFLILTKSLTLPSNVTLEGIGDESEIFSTETNLNLIVTEANAENVTVRNLKLTGSGTGTQPTNSVDAPNPDGAGCGIVFVGVNRGLIENVTVNNCGGTGDSSVPNNNGVAGIWLTYGCHDCIVVRNRVSKCRNGINEDNFFCSATKDAVNNIFSENYIDQCRFGVATDCYLTAKGLQVTNNIIRNCAYSAIDVNKTSLVLIRGNWLEGNGNTGTLNTYSPTIHIYGDSNGYFPPNNVTVEGNMVINNYGHGIKVTNNSYYANIFNNQIIGNLHGSGILLQSTRYYTIKGNMIQGNGNSGIYANPLTLNGVSVSVDKGIIEGNQIRSNQHHGIYMEKAQFVVIANNRIDNNGQAATATYSGIALTLNSTYNVLSNNIIQGSGHKYGVGFLDAQTNLNMVIGNILNANNQDYGFASAIQYMQGNFMGVANQFTLKSPNGTVYKIMISDDGVLSQTLLS